MFKRHVFAFSLISLACFNSSFAASLIDLKHQPVSALQSQLSLKEISSDVDFNQTKHIRVQQMYAGHPVWGADAVMHIPQGKNNNLNHLTSTTTMNGLIYQGLEADLRSAPAYSLTAGQADKALQQAISLYQKKTDIRKYDASTVKKDLIVYIDKNKKAHWACLITFLTSAPDGLPALPTYIIDATTLEVYEQWNNIQTQSDVKGGGFGGNSKTTQLVYDGATGNLPAFNIQRDDVKRTCTLANSGVIVKDDNHKGGIFDVVPAVFDCQLPSAAHNNLYWSGDSDAVNGGFSPANDAMYIGQVIKDMYQTWYGIPVLTFLKVFPMQIKLNVHVKDTSGQPMENAFFHPLTKEMYFGDGGSRFYPLTSLGVGAHEISHGFTSQHSNLAYSKQSGGLNEAFSDMAAQAAEFYSTGHNSWQIGPEIVKGEGALRYMDDPTKDGKSIGHVKDYTDELNVHHSSGIFNKLFYLLGTTKGWDTHKAFNVMVKANMNYWTANSTFADAACGVINATKDYNKESPNDHYDTEAVKIAMQGVGLNDNNC
jgi:pseudolysin